MIRTLAQSAIVLALLFEVSIDSANPGIGYLLFWLAALLATAAVNRACERPLVPQLWMFLPPLGFAISVTLYDASTVKFWSTSLALLTLLWAVSWNLIPRPGLNGRLFPPQTFHPGRLKNAAENVWKPLAFRESGTRSQAMAISRGLLLSAPLLLLFGILLSSADAAFSSLLEHLWGGVSWSLPFRFTLLTILFSAWLKLWLNSEQAAPFHPRLLIGAVEFNVILTVLNLLFASFLALQLSYLFGGGQWMLDHAEFARRGFFELSACIALLLPLVALACQTAHLTDNVGLRWLAGGLILQTCGLAVSAFARMMLYIAEYGMSIERFYAACGIIVALFVLAWAAFVCCSPHDTAWLVTRQTVTVLFLLSALSLFNTEGWIAHYNIERARQGKSLDLHYLQNFSCDSIPAIQQSKEVFKSTDFQATTSYILAQTSTSNRGTSWNLSRWRADP